jgi:hypothetical protein
MGLFDYFLDWLRRRGRTSAPRARARAASNTSVQRHAPAFPRGAVRADGRLRRCPRSLFFKEEMELSLIGLNAAGKTSLVNVIAVRAQTPQPNAQSVRRRLALVPPRASRTLAGGTRCAAWARVSRHEPQLLSSDSARVRRRAPSART